MNVFKTVILQSDDDSVLFCDTIEWQGKLWLVPEWFAGPAPGTKVPARIIGLDSLPLSKALPGYQADYMVPFPLSKATLAGSTAEGLVVIDAPAIIQSADALH